MKRSIFIAFMLVLCIGLAGCISIQSADTEPTMSPEQIINPAPERVPEPEEPAIAEVPELSAPAEASSGQGALPGLTAHYPWERLPLPEGSEFVKLSSVEDTDKYVEYTQVKLPMTKTEAVAYFKPLLEKDSDLFVQDDDLTYPSLEIQGAFPDVVSFTSLYGRYTQEMEPNIKAIILNLYTPADGETLLVAEIQVNYLSKP